MASARRRSARIPGNQADGTAAAFKAMGDPFRLRILDLLPDRPECDLVFNVNELVDALGGSQPNMSHHLKILCDAGLIKKNKMCNSVYYHKSRERFDSLRSCLKGLKKGARPGKKRG